MNYYYLNYRYAIRHCRSIDMDNYMLLRNAEQNEDNDEGL